MLRVVFLFMFYHMGNSQMTQIYSAFTANTFSSADGWSVIGGSAGYDVRNGQTIFGGNNVFGAGVSIYRQILTPSPHHTIKLKLMIWAINTWDNESVQTKINGEIADQQTVSSNQANSFGQFLYQEIIYSHTQQSLILEITSSLQAPATQKSWGVRDIFIYSYNCPVGCLFCTYLNANVNDCTPYILKLSQFSGYNFYSNEGWIVTNQQISQNVCDQITTFGKYQTGTIITRQYFFEPHFQLRIRFQFWKIDALLTSFYSLIVDDQVVWQDFKGKYHKIEICGSNSKPEQYYNVDLTIQHINQYATFKFVSDVISPTDYFGIREFEVFILACDPSCNLCETNAKSCITGTKLIQNLLESDLTQNTFSAQTSWGSYAPSDSSGQISKPFLTDTYFPNMNYLSFYNLLYKDFQLDEHDKIKIQFQAYASGSTQNINLKIDEDYDEIIQLGDTVPTSACTPALTFNIEDYSYWEYIYDHTANFVRVYFESQPYISGDYKYGFNQFNIYQIKEDCSTTPCTQLESIVDSNFFMNTFTDPQSWQLLSYSYMAITLCDSKSVVGGVNIANKNVFLQKRLSITQSHIRLRLQLTIYFLEAWTPAKSLRILADKVIIWDQSVNYQTNIQNLCSTNNSYKDQMVTVDVSFPHNKGTVTFQFVIQNGDGSEFYAIRDYQLFYGN